MPAINGSHPNAGKSLEQPAEMEVGKACRLCFLISDRDSRALDKIIESTDSAPKARNATKLPC